MSAYDILGLRPDATKQEVETAYAKLFPILEGDQRVELTTAYQKIVTHYNQSHYADIIDFHHKFKVPVLQGAPKLLEGEALKFRIDFLQEELNELKKAHEDGDLEEAVDALIDLAVVLYGTGQFLGMSEEMWNDAWKEVHAANMTKVRCEDASQSKRGTALDIRKPEGWVKPSHKKIIEKYSK